MRDVGVGMSMSVSVSAVCGYAGLMPALCLFICLYDSSAWVPWRCGEGVGWEGMESERSGGELREGEGCDEIRCDMRGLRHES